MINQTFILFIAYNLLRSLKISFLPPFYDDFMNHNVKRIGAKLGFNGDGFMGVVLFEDKVVWVFITHSVLVYVYFTYS